MKTTEGNVSKWLIPAITGIIAIAFGVVTYHRGRFESPDTNIYATWADILISSNFNYLQMARSISFVAPSVLYSGWITVVALFKVALGPAWPTGIIVLNYCLTLPAIWGTLDLVKRTTQSALCILVAGALLLIVYDLFNWIRYVLSDISFMAIALATYYLLCLLMTSTEKRSSLLLKLYLTLIIVALLYRPTGVLLVLVGGLTYLTQRVIKNKSSVERARLALRIAGGLSLLVLAAVVAHAYFMKEPSSWPLSFASQWIQRLSGEYKQGYVVFQRPETYVLNPDSLLDYIFITLKKLVYFFSFFADSFSPLHKAANLAFFVPVYILALAAVINLFRGNSRMTVTEWWAGWIALVLIAAFALFHAVQQVDYDWRYRLPCILPLIVLSGIGLRSLAPGNRIVEGVRSGRSKQPNHTF
jgi:hypothetical protein